MAAEQDKTALPPFVVFTTRAVEDRSKLLEAGMYGFRDVEIAKITRPGERDTVEKVASEWLDSLAKQAADGNIPRDWVQAFRDQYTAWKAGLELPLEGTPIRGWPLIMPSQAEELFRFNIRTVEQLAGASADALSRIAMGGLTLQERAKTWLKTAADGVGKTVMRVETIELENAALKTQLASVMADLARLKQDAAVA